MPIDEPERVAAALAGLMRQRAAALGTALTLHLLIDPARDERIFPALPELGEDVRCLFQGQRAQDLADVAPYLATVAPDAPFLEWFVRWGWADAWGLFVLAPLDLDQLRRHFRRFTVVATEDGRPLFFRFYDPRVLRSVLPTCDKDQLARFFGPIDCFACEAPSGDALQVFELADGSLRDRPLPLPR